ncbi:MAG: hypothetical protein ABJA98_05050, partial [Acidobacteriota bacterium]
MARESSACPAACGRGPTSEDGADAPSGFVALSKFVVANDMTASVKAAFRHRSHLVDGAAGYLKMEVLSPSERPEEIWLVTF